MRKKDRTGQSLMPKGLLRKWLVLKRVWRTLLRLLWVKERQTDASQETKTRSPPIILTPSISISNMEYSLRRRITLILRWGMWQPCIKIWTASSWKSPSRTRWHRLSSKSASIQSSKSNCKNHQLARTARVSRRSVPTWRSPCQRLISMLLSILRFKMLKTTSWILELKLTEASS